MYCALFLVINVDTRAARDRTRFNDPSDVEKNKGMILFDHQERSG